MEEDLQLLMVRRDFKETKPSYPDCPTVLVSRWDIRAAALQPLNEKSNMWEMSHPDIFLYLDAGGGTGPRLPPFPLISTPKTTTNGLKKIRVRERAYRLLRSTLIFFHESIITQFHSDTSDYARLLCKACAPFLS